MSTLLQRINATEKYPETVEIACSKCPQSLWYQKNLTIRCHCIVLGEIVYTSCSRPDANQTSEIITDCDGINLNNDDSTTSIEHGDSELTGQPINTIQRSNHASGYIENTTPKAPNAH